MDGKKTFGVVHPLTERKGHVEILVALSLPVNGVVKLDWMEDVTLWKQRYFSIILLCFYIFSDSREHFGVVLDRIWHV